MGHSGQLAKVTLLVTIMLLAPVAGAGGAAGATAQDGSSADETTGSSADDSEFITPEEGVSIWKQSPISLEANASNANVSVDLPSVFVETAGDGADGKLNRSAVGVYDTDEEMKLRFGTNDNVDATAFDGEAQLVTLYDDSPMTDALASDAADGSLEDRVLDRTVETAAVEIEDGTFTRDVNFDQGPGYYTFIVADVDISDGMPDDATILGVDQAVAQDEPSSVDVASSADPGSNVTFDVDSTAFDDDDEVEQSVVLYNESTVTDSDIRITIPEDIDTGSGAELADDVSVETDIGSIDGVHTVTDEDGSQNVSDEVVFDDVIESMVGDRVGDPLHTGDRQLDASSAAVVGNASENITVETLENWTESDYRWIHLATSTGASSDQLQANTGLLEINASSGGGGSGGIGGGGIGGGGGSPADPEFSVTEAGLSSSEIAVGEDVDVTAKIEETSGDRGGQFTAELVVDGEVVDEQTVTVFGGGSEDVTFTRSFDEAGEYEIEVSDATAGTLTVSESGPGESGDEASFEVTDASLSDTELEVGDDLDVTATVENTGDESGTFTAELTVDGQVVDEKSVTLNGSESTDVTFTHPFNEAGEFDIGVSGTGVGTVTVSDAELLPVPGFGMTGALVVLLAVALLGARLQRE